MKITVENDKKNAILKKMYLINIKSICFSHVSEMHRKEGSKL